MKQALRTLALILWSAISSAGSAAASVWAEIEALLAQLQAPGCEFNRNGTWHSGAEAKAHAPTIARRS